MRLRASFWILGVSLAAAVAGCGSSSDDGGGSGGSAGGTGGAGGSGAGATECVPTADICYVAGPTGPGAACMAKADFSAQDVTQLRVTSHQVASPVALASPFVQDSIITKKSALIEPECNLDGSGQFNLLMEVDTAQKQITLGGGVPQKKNDIVDPPKDGTCYAPSYTDPNSGLDVKPVTQSYTEQSDGTLEALFPEFVMPIYVEDKVDPDSAVLVPLHEMTFAAKLSDDKNCVGRYAPEQVNPDLSCQPDQGKFAWKTAGRYQGYITVEEADNVFVVSLGETLCVVLTNDPSKWKGPLPDASCKSSKGFTETGALPKGDWCSTTNSADGCQDSWRLVIDIAAQAIPINGEYGKDCP